MRIPFWPVRFLLAVVAVTGVELCAAQPASAPTKSMGGCTGLPYSAKETTTYSTHTADGTPTQNTVVHLLWRDAEGRTRSEITGKSQFGKYDFVSVYEPVKREHWTGIGVSKPPKIVHVRPFADSETSPRCLAPPDPQLLAGVPKQYPGEVFKTLEKLPPDTINGISVVGYREKLVWPAGTRTSESWISPDLGVEICYSRDDSRTGKYFKELSDVHRTAPDPSLFKVPEGFLARIDPPPAPSPLDEVMRDQKPVLPDPPKPSPK